MTHYDDQNQEATMNDANELDAMALHLQQLNGMAVRLQQLAEQRRHVPPPLPPALPPVPPLAGTRKTTTLNVVYGKEYDGDRQDKATINNILISAVRKDPLFNYIVTNYTQALVRNKIHTNDFEALSENSEFGKVTGHFTLFFSSNVTQERTTMFHINLVQKTIDGNVFWTFAGFSVRGLVRSKEQMLNVYID